MPYIFTKHPTLGDPNTGNPKAFWCCTLQHPDDLESLAKYLGEPFLDITGASGETETGDYTNLYVTWSSRPYLDQTQYYRVEWKMPSYMGHILNGNEHSKSAFIHNAATLKEVWDASPELTEFQAIGAFDQNGTCDAILFGGRIYLPEKVYLTRDEEPEDE